MTFEIDDDITFDWAYRGEDSAPLAEGWEIIGQFSYTLTDPIGSFMRWAIMEGVGENANDERVPLSIREQEMFPDERSLPVRIGNDIITDDPDGVDRDAAESIITESVRALDEVETK